MKNNQKDKKAELKLNYPKTRPKTSRGIQKQLGSKCKSPRNAKMFSPISSKKDSVKFKKSGKASKRKIKTGVFEKKRNNSLSSATELAEKDIGYQQRTLRSNESSPGCQENFPPFQNTEEGTQGNIQVKTQDIEEELIIIQKILRGY